MIATKLLILLLLQLDQRRDQSAGVAANYTHKSTHQAIDSLRRTRQLTLLLLQLGQRECQSAWPAAGSCRTWNGCGAREQGLTAQPHCPACPAASRPAGTATLKWLPTHTCTPQTVQLADMLWWRNSLIVVAVLLQNHYMPCWGSSCWHCFSE